MNHRIKVREQVQRIVKVVETVKGFGSVITQIDPLHAGLPWAGIIVLLNRVGAKAHAFQALACSPESEERGDSPSKDLLTGHVILSDSKQNEGVLDGIEEINRLIARYSAIEELYLGREDLELKAEYRESLTSFYAAIIGFQATAVGHFARNKSVRTIKSTLQLEDWAKLLNEVKTKDVTCKEFTDVFNYQDQRAGMLHLKEALEHNDSKLHNVLDRLRLSQEDNLEILIWYSDITYGNDHDQIRATLGYRYANSGQWLLSHVNQRLQSYDSSVAWLCGTVGSGKTCAISNIVQHLTPRLAADIERHVACFYMSQKQVGRSESIDIFRCLIAQLAWSADGTSIAEPVKTIYDERGRDRISGGGKPSLEECVAILQALCNAWPRITIIIDALDGCSAPSEVLCGLEEIRTKATSTVQIIVSSRMHVDVPVYRSDCEKIQIDEGKNSEDIEIYVREEVNSGGSQKRRLLDGKRPYLEARLVQILIARAQEMFIWVKLQLAVFFPRNPQHRTRLSNEVDSKLNALENDSTLPETDSLYREILDRNTKPGTLARSYAITALQWILCAVENLPLDELAKAVSIDSEGKFNKEIDGAMVLGLCSNFILVDERGPCRLSHLSAKGSLLGSDGDEHRKGLLTAAESHAKLARCCLSFIANNKVRGNEAHRSFASYAAFNWAYHAGGAKNYREVEPLKTMFLKFMDPLAISPAFSTWTEAVSNSLETNDSCFREDYHPSGAPTRVKTSTIIRRNVLSIAASPPFPAFVAASFGLLEILHVTPSSDLTSRRGKTGESSLNIPIYGPQVEAVSYLLTVEGVDAALKTWGSTALHLASMLGLDDISSLLLGHLSPAEVYIQDQHGETALHKSAYYSREACVDISVTRMQPADLALVDTAHRTALHLAVRGRNSSVVGRLAINMRPKNLAIQDDFGGTALTWCAEQGEEELVKILVSRMTSGGILRQHHDGNTALHLATYYVEQSCVDLLLSSMSSEDLAITNKVGATPLHVTMYNHERHGEGAIKVLSAFSDHQSSALVAQTLLAHMDHANLRVQDSSRRTVLHLALTKKSTP